MRPPSPESLIEALANALQTMAFISPEPVDGTFDPPASADCVSVRWSGAGTGRVRLAAPSAFGELLECNILALEPGTPEAAARSIDALRELCNVTTGAMLGQLCDDAEETPEMGLPSVEHIPDAAAWQAFASGPGTSLLFAEGFYLALRVEEPA